MSGNDALLNIILRLQDELSGAAQGAAGALDGVERSAEDAQGAIKKLGEGPTSELDELRAEITSLHEEMDKLGEKGKEGGEKAAEGLLNLEKARVALEVLRQTLEFVRGGIDDMAAAGDKDAIALQASMKKAEEAINGIRNSIVKSAIPALQWLADAIADTDSAVSTFDRTMARLAKEGSDKEIVKRWKALQDEREAWRDLGHAIEDVVATTPVGSATDGVIEAVRKHERDLQGIATRYRAAAARYQEARQALAQDTGGGGGINVEQEIADKRHEWERERVDDARQAALEIKYWNQDQNEWIADNAAKLTPELAAEFAERTRIAQEEANKIKETDAGLATELLDAEKSYQEEKAAIASDTSLTEEERTAKLAILERENQERVERARETAELEAQMREEARQRELQKIRESAAAAGKASGEAFRKELETAFNSMREEDNKRREEMIANKERVKGSYEDTFDRAIERAKELLGLTREIRDTASGTTFFGRASGGQSPEAVPVSEESGVASPSTGPAASSPGPTRAGTMGTPSTGRGSPGAVTIFAIDVSALAAELDKFHRRGGA